ncbi:hypothetical protein Tco_0449474 [Tanacetum coccineum]
MHDGILVLEIWRSWHQEVEIDMQCLITEVDGFSHVSEAIWERSTERCSIVVVVAELTWLDQASRCDVEGSSDSSNGLAKGEFYGSVVEMSAKGCGGRFCGGREVTTLDREHEVRCIVSRHIVEDPQHGIHGVDCGAGDKSGAEEWLDERASYDTKREIVVIVRSCGASEVAKDCLWCALSRDDVAVTGRGASHMDVDVCSTSHTLGADNLVAAYVDDVLSGHMQWNICVQFE